MTQDQIKEILKRVETWPLERQEDAVAVLLEMEAEGTEVFRLSPEEREELTRAMDDVARGESISATEVEAVFARYRK